ncbi:MAG: 8-amino-7-oxononanoate synthase [Flavobacterium sp. BFFFF2]|nr:MAG: 8-amino-7-oxononanoate synthase [Flavobacterium sp. BFFFF2]
MSTADSYEILLHADQLPPDWDQLAQDNLFLGRAYCQVLNETPANNMSCFFASVWHENKLAGILVSQFIDLSGMHHYGARRHCFKTRLRKFALKNYASHVLFIGNNMLTGQNACAFLPEVPTSIIPALLKKAALQIQRQLKSEGVKIHLTVYKDFPQSDLLEELALHFTDHYRFEAQPSMVFDIPTAWETDANYVDALTKKYRDQFKRARKKGSDLVKRQLSLEELLNWEDTLHDLYLHVANNALFNTFYLQKGHFYQMKKILADQFLVYGYFQENQLVGFNTLIKNGSVMDTYFLGYFDLIQKEKMLYLNMLYDMVAYSIKKGFKSLVFARTALEIKSSVGAQPVSMTAFMKHENRWVHQLLPIIYKRLEPEVIWQARNPFKHTTHDLICTQNTELAHLP